MLFGKKNTLERHSLYLSAPVGEEVHHGRQVLVMILGNEKSYAQESIWLVKPL